MSVLDKFRIINDNSGKAFVSITDNGVTFSQEAIRLLGKPDHVCVLVNTDDKQFAIQPCDKDHKAARLFVKPGRKGQIGVRWNNKNVIQPIIDMLPEDRAPEGVRVGGRYYEEENCIIFDCKRTYKLTRGRRSSD